MPQPPKKNHQIGVRKTQGRSDPADNGKGGQGGNGGTGGGGLAKTGASVGIIAALGGLLTAAGAAMAKRRRKGNEQA